jgi:hypothetical protein
MPKQTKEGAAKPATKQPRVRSPNYPSLDLQTAVGKLPALFEAMKRHPIGVEVAVSKMGYSFNSSTGKLALASMRSYGLFDNERDGSGSMVKLSTLALDIASDYPRESPHWWAAVKKAALAPAVHQQLWAKYGSALPADDEIRRFLLHQLKFNDNAVAPFIDEYKATIAFARLSEEDTIGGGETEDEDNRKSPAIGDYVQWTSGGVDQFQIPKLVEDVSDDGIWALLKGDKTGVQMDELTVVDPPSPAAKLKAGVAAGRSKNPFTAQDSGVGPSITFPLPNDNRIEIRLAKRVSKKDFERIKKLVDLSEDSLVEPSDDGEKQVT